MIQKYNDKYAAETMVKAFAAMVTMAHQNYAGYINDWIHYENALRDVLAVEGVSQLFYFGYFGFTHQMYRLYKHFGGLSLQLAAATLIAKYVSWGLSPSLLGKIRFQVFEVSPPAGP